MADEITCLIADDHEVVREGLRLALSRSPRIRVIGEATDGASAVALTERRRPDVVIMDLRMPDMDGLEATEQLLAEGARTPASSSSRRTASARCSSAGSSPARAATSSRRRRTRRSCARSRRSRPARRSSTPGSWPSSSSAQGQADILTPREREILQLLADGMSNADVAAKLFISQETVKSHVRHILAKLEADTRTQAVAIALREAMID